MAGRKEQVRLPELPLFKRFSLALRQEYAGADEVLTLLDRTASRIEQLLEKAEEEPEPQSGPEIEASTQAEAATAEPGPAPPEELQGLLETVDEEYPGLPEDDEADEEAPESSLEVEWGMVPEEGEIESLLVPPSRPRKRTAEPKSRPSQKRKKRKPAAKVVRVSPYGKPLDDLGRPAARKAPAREAPAKKRPGKPAARKAGRAAARSKPAAKRSKGKGRSR